MIKDGVTTFIFSNNFSMLYRNVCAAVEHPPFALQYSSVTREALQGDVGDRGTSSLVLLQSSLIGFLKNLWCARKQTGCPTWFSF